MTWQTVLHATALLSNVTLSHHKTQQSTLISEELVWKLRRLLK